MSDKMNPEIEVCKDLIARNNDGDFPIRGDFWGSNDLKKLTREALIERLILVDNRATLLKWRILASLRAKFTSDKLYGQYLDEIRKNPEYAHLIGKQQDMNRAALAGSFCEEHNITDLREAGLIKSTVYELSRPQNAEIQDKIYRTVKGKRLPLEEVRRLVKQEKAFTIPFKKNIVQKPIDSEEITDEDDTNLLEKELYPLLARFLKTKLNLRCYRIDERISTRGNVKDFNLWLHPDIVAMKAIDEDLNENVRTLQGQDSRFSVNYLSFEVKRKLIQSNVRKNFFQAVSNSSWAHEGYLVAPVIVDKVRIELKILSELYGIGVILLNQENPSKSEILYPAKQRPKQDERSIQRIMEVNSDFKEFILEVRGFAKSGRTHPAFWM